MSIEAGALQRLARGRDGAEAHAGRVHAGHGRGDHACQRGEVELACLALAHDQDGRCAIVDAGRVARRDRAALPEGGPQSGQRLQRRVGTRVLVAIDERALATLAAGNLDRHDLLGEDALLLGTGGTALALQRE